MFTFKLMKKFRLASQPECSTRSNVFAVWLHFQWKKRTFKQEVTLSPIRWKHFLYKLKVTRFGYNITSGGKIWFFDPEVTCFQDGTSSGRNIISSNRKLRVLPVRNHLQSTDSIFKPEVAIEYWDSQTGSDVKNNPSKIFCLTSLSTLKYDFQTESDVAEEYCNLIKKQKSKISQ